MLHNKRQTPRPVANVSNSEAFDVSPKVRHSREKELAGAPEKWQINQWDLAVKVGMDD